MYGKTLRVAGLLFLVTAAAAMTRAAAAGMDEPSTPDSVVEIEIKNFRFIDDTIRIEPGTSIRWTNRDQVGHTSTAQNGEWESPLLGPGESFEFRFDEEGEYPYNCTPHPFMRGWVIVASDAHDTDRR